MKKRISYLFYSLFIGLFVLFFVGVDVNADDFENPVKLTHEGSPVSYEIRTNQDDDATLFRLLYSTSIDYSDSLSYTIHYSDGDAVAEAGTISPYYNCYAFALYFKGDIPEDSSAIYITNPNIYFTDGSLVEVDIDAVENDDIIAYYNSDFNLIHVGIVTDATITTLEDLEIKSKDGDGFIFNHSPRACTYYKGDDSKIKFYRWNHIVSTVSSYDDTVHNYICSTCNKVTNDKHSILYTKTDSPNAHLKACTICSYSIADGHDYVQVGTKYRCFECGYVSSFKPITPVGRSISGLLFVCSYDASQTPRTYSEMVSYLRVNNYNDLLEEFNDFYNNLNK